LIVGPKPLEENLILKYYETNQSHPKLYQVLCLKAELRLRSDDISILREKLYIDTYEDFYLKVGQRGRKVQTLS